LKEDGFEIEGKGVGQANRRDYVYTLKNSQYKKKEYWVEGKLVATKYEK